MFYLCTVLGKSTHCPPSTKTSPCAPRTIICFYNFTVIPFLIPNAITSSIEQFTVPYLYKFNQPELKLKLSLFNNTATSMISSLVSTKLFHKVIINTALQAAPSVFKLGGFSSPLARLLNQALMY